MYLLFQAGSVVYTAGAQPLLVTYELVEHGSKEKRATWVRSVVKSQHTHDIRAITLTDKVVVTGGKFSLLFFGWTT